MKVSFEKETVAMFTLQKPAYLGKPGFAGNHGTVRC